MLTSHPNAPKALVSWIENWISRNHIPPTVPVELSPLAGDGSTRTFFRLKWKNESRILLSDPGWISSKDYPPHQLFLEQRGIPVPKFQDADVTAGFLVMEDLGDELLQYRLKADPESKMRWLRGATELLAHWHGKTFPVPATLPASTRRFDTQKYFDELCFTEEHLSKNFLGLPELGPGELAAIREFCEEISGIAPDTLQHRDYHTRNLLVHGERLFVIDFQDARLGPPHYDLASLLYDAYVPLTPGQREGLLTTYQTELKVYVNLYEKISWDSFREDLRRVAFQRVVKAAGSFASFFTRHGKSTHLPYLLPALRSAMALREESPKLGKIPGSAIRLEAWIERAEKRQ